MKKILYIFCFFLCLNSTSAYLDKYDSYKGLKENIMKVHNQEYGDYKKNQIYKNTAEYQGLVKDYVKVKTIFDISQEELDNKVQEQKINIINKIKNSTDVKVGVSQIDRTISSLEKRGKYFVLRVPGEFVYIQEGQYIYVYPHRLKGNVKLVTQIQQIMSSYKGKEGESVTNPDEFRTKLLDLFDSYKIKYKEVNDYFISGDVFLGKNSNFKQNHKYPFFISKGFTTPDLEEKVEGELGIKQYIWTYITQENIEYTYSIKNISGTEVFAKIWDKNYYLGRLNDIDTVYTNDFASSDLDIYIYQINKNKYEYFLFVFMLLLGIASGLYLSINFIGNYKNNFKKIPEEI